MGPCLAHSEPGSRAVLVRIIHTGRIFLFFFCVCVCGKNVKSSIRQGILVATRDFQSGEPWSRLVAMEVESNLSNELARKLVGHLRYQYLVSMDSHQDFAANEGSYSKGLTPMILACNILQRWFSSSGAMTLRRSSIPKLPCTSLRQATLPGSK